MMSEISIKRKNEIIQWAIGQILEPHYRFISEKHDATKLGWFVHKKILMHVKASLLPIQDGSTFHLLDNDNIYNDLQRDMGFNASILYGKMNFDHWAQYVTPHIKAVDRRYHRIKIISDGTYNSSVAEISTIPDFGSISDEECYKAMGFYI